MSELKASNEIAGKMVLEILGEESSQLKKRLFNGFIRFTAPLWNGVPCEEYGNIFWGQFFLSELSFDELGKSLPCDQRDDGHKISVTGVPFFKIYATGEDHPDGLPILMLAIEKKLMDMFVAVRSASTDKDRGLK